jgi:hypothetical protein
MTDRQTLIVKRTLLGVTALNLLMCLNLYRQVGNLEYKVNQLEESVYAAMQSLSTDVYTLKNSQPTNKTGQFE